MFGIIFISSYLLILILTLNILYCTVFYFALLYEYRNTGYVTEAEKFGWSFVLEPLLLELKLGEIIKQVDHKTRGLGRVK